MLLCAAWGIDTAVSGDRVVRNVEVAGVPIGGLDRDDLIAVANSLNDDLAAEPVAVQLGSSTVEANAGELGAMVDADLLVDRALDARRGGFILAQPFRWVGTFFSTDTIDVPYDVDTEVATTATQTLIDTSLSLPVEPQFETDGAAISVTPGVEGATLEEGALEAALQEAIDGGTPYRLRLTPTPLMPKTDTAVLEAIADEASTATNTARTISVLGSSAIVEPAMLRSWVILDTEAADGPTWAIDPKKSLEDLQTMFPNLGSADQLAHFDVVDGKPIIVPPSSSVFCCQSDSPELIRADLIAGTDPIELVPETASGDDAVKALEALGVIEEVSTFTTKHNCCENRVINIQRMADIVRGHVVLPGEQFSLNTFVGKRTEANGFLPAGAIADGIIEAQVGGGVSQFTTTIFNAVFFAGLQFDEYQSHSIYFSRYPYGREATVSYPAPDFKFTNTSPYGVLIWPTYTDNSITVTLYSTKNVTVEDVGRTETSQGECTRVTTNRQMTFTDGTVKNDSVFAVYRPGEGLDCNGNPTKSAPTTAPPATTPTTEVPPETTPTTAAPPATTAPTTAPAATTPTSEG